MPARELFGLWAVWTLSRCGGHLTGWTDAWNGWRQVSLADVSPTGWPAGLLRHGLTLGLAGVLLLAQAGAGWHLQSLCRARRLSRWERGAIAVLLGFAVVGTAGFGLACAGLFRLPLLLPVGLGGLLLTGCRMTVAAIRSARPGRPPGWWWFAIAPAGIAAIRALVPDTHVDTYTYHLATTEAWLKAGTLSLAGAGLPHHFPMTAECVAAIPVAWGIETAVPFIHLAVFVAGLALVRPGWAGLALGMTGGLVLMHLPLAKNDLAAAGCLVGAVALAVRGGPAVLIGLLLGGASGIKLNGPPVALAVLGWMAVTGGGGRVPMTLVAASMPFLPWLVKSWLMTGDPVYPVLAPHLRSVAWDAESTRAVAWMTSAEPAGAWLPRLPADFWRALVEYLPGVALLLPAVIMAGWSPRRRGLLLIAVADLILCRALMPSEWYRLALPGFVILAAVVPAAMDPGRPALVAIAVAGWLPLGRQVLAGVNAPVVAGYLAGTVPRAEYAARMFTTLDRARRDLAQLPGVRGVLLSGEIRSFQLPGRPIHERCWGRTHAWALAGASRTPEEIARRVRQLGASHLLYNFVTEQFPHRYFGEFGWDDRRLRVWREYVSRWTRPAVLPPGVDLPNGGFVIYALARDPAARAPAVLPFLPGIAGMVFRVAGPADPDLAWRESLLLERRVPGVLHIRNLVGIGAMRRGDAAAAYRWLKPGVDAGIADVGNFTEFAFASLRLGRSAEARRALARVPGR